MALSTSSIPSMHSVPLPVLFEQTLARLPVNAAASFRQAAFTADPRQTVLCSDFMRAAIQRGIPMSRARVTVRADTSLCLIWEVGSGARVDFIDDNTCWVFDNRTAGRRPVVVDYPTALEWVKARVLRANV